MSPKELLSHNTIEEAYRTCNCITEWEYEFCMSIYNFTVISDKQEVILIRIYNKLRANLDPKDITFEPDPATFGQNPFTEPDYKPTILRLVKDNRIVPKYGT